MKSLFFRQFETHIGLDEQSSIQMGVIIVDWKSLKKNLEISLKFTHFYCLHVTFY